MTDFLANLATRIADPTIVLRPRVPSLFEPTTRLPELYAGDATAWSVEEVGLPAASPGASLAERPARAPAAPDPVAGPPPRPLAAAPMPVEPEPAPGETDPGPARSPAVAARSLGAPARTEPPPAPRGSAAVRPPPGRAGRRAARRARAKPPADPLPGRAGPRAEPAPGAAVPDQAGRFVSGPGPGPPIVEAPSGSRRAGTSGTARSDIHATAGDPPPTAPRHRAGPPGERATRLEAASPPVTSAQVSMAAPPQPADEPSPRVPLDRPPTAGPAVYVSIGRVEVRAVPEPAPLAAPPAVRARRPPLMSLDDYARERTGEGDR